VPSVPPAADARQAPPAGPGSTPSGHPYPCPITSSLFPGTVRSQVGHPPRLPRPDVSPTVGFAPLAVTFGGAAAAAPKVVVDLDVDGDGVPKSPRQVLAR
jgi:hypothetical protein